MSYKIKDDFTLSVFGVVFTLFC